MTLYPGGPCQVAGQYVFDDTAARSWRKPSKRRWLRIPDGQGDAFARTQVRRIAELLFIAIADGVIKYLEAQQNDVSQASRLTSTGPSVTHTVSNVDLNITMDK